MPSLELQLTKQGWDLSQAQDCRSTVSGFYMPAPHPSFSSLNTLKCPNLGPLTHLFNSTFGGSIMIFFIYVLIFPQFNSISLVPSMKPLYSFKKKGYFSFTSSTGSWEILSSDFWQLCRQHLVRIGTVFTKSIYWTFSVLGIARRGVSKVYSLFEHVLFMT